MHYNHTPAVRYAAESRITDMLARSARVKAPLSSGRLTVSILYMRGKA
jgi:hypothetical protein